MFYQGIFQCTHLSLTKQTIREILFNFFFLTMIKHYAVIANSGKEHGYKKSKFSLKVLVLKTYAG